MNTVGICGSDVNSQSIDQQLIMFIIFCSVRIVLGEWSRRGPWLGNSPMFHNHFGLISSRKVSSSDGAIVWSSTMSLFQMDTFWTFSVFRQAEMVNKFRLALEKIRSIHRFEPSQQWHAHSAHDSLRTRASSEFIAVCAEPSQPVRGYLKTK